MSCWNPIPIKSPKKSGSDYLVNFVPCGKCLGCLQRRRDSWSIRIYEESKKCVLSTFLTLTYNDENLKFTPYGLPILYKPDLQKYFKRVRSEVPNLRYYACGEYGEHTNRPHYHGIVFNVPNDILNDKWSNEDGPMGFVSCDEVTLSSIHYVTKYITNEQGSTKSYGYIKPFQIMSKGLGKEYLDVTKDYHSDTSHNFYTSPGGVKHCLPRYYNDRLYSEEQRQEMGEKAIKEALMKMEKQSEIDPMYHKKSQWYKTYHSNKTSKSKKV